MTKMFMITLLAVLASATADPYIFSSPLYSYAPTYSAYTAPAYSAALTAAPAYPAAYAAPAYTAAYTAPAYSAALTAAAIPAAATIPAAAAIPATVPATYPGAYPVQAMGYSYGSSAYSVQEVPVAAAASAPLVLGSPFDYYLRR